MILNVPNFIKIKDQYSHFHFLNPKMQQVPSQLSEDRKFYII